MIIVDNLYYNSPIHKAAGSLVTGHSLQNGKMSMGNRCTERPPDPVLYGGRPSGSFVNSAVIHSIRSCRSMYSNFKGKKVEQPNSAKQQGTCRAPLIYAHRCCADRLRTSGGLLKILLEMRKKVNCGVGVK